MDMLIKHGTWIAIPAGLVLAFLYVHVYAKVYPFLVARSLAGQDERKHAVVIRLIVPSRKRAAVGQASEPVKAA